MLKAGVLGAGVFGGYHARKYASLDDVELVGVFDHHAAHAEKLAAELGAKAFSDLDAFLAAVDVATVATPADSHAELARAVLGAGRHCYVEKPLAITRDDAAQLVAAAQAKALILACGHQERVVFEAMGLMAAPERPLRIEAVRRGMPSERNRDVSCVLDLMIHDLDLGLALSGAWESVQAAGSYDEVEAEVYFGRTCIGLFEASRVADKRERTMRLEYPSGTVEIDFLAPSFSNGAGFALNADFASTSQGKDPLGASVGAFLGAIRGQGRPAVDGVAGAAALDLALAIEGAAGL